MEDNKDGEDKLRCKCKNALKKKKNIFDDNAKQKTSIFFLATSKSLTAENRYVLKKVFLRTLLEKL